jgi:hypothetical protein
VIGTFSPDLEYLVRLQPMGKFGHSPRGLVLFCVPATLLAWWIWRALVRPALVPLLPPGLRRAAEAPPPGRRSDVWPLAVFAALLGAATHVLWDGFTHPTGWAVAMFPALSAAAFGRPNLPWFSLFQYASSVAGVAIAAVWTAVELRRFPPEARRFAPGQGARLARFACLVAFVSLAAAAANAPFGDSLPARLGRAAVGAMIGFALSLVLYGIFQRWRGETALEATS